MTKVTILCEDITHERFIRKYLICRGFDDRKIKPFPSLKGRKVNNNNAFAISNYAKIVKSYRLLKNSQELAIVVMIDADDKTVAERMKALHTALNQEKGGLNNDTRNSGEKISIFVPTRNIETWFYYIGLGQNSSEQKCDQLTDYKQEKYSSLSKTARIKLAEESAIKLAAICPQGLTEDVPESLRLACKEITRII